MNAVAVVLVAILVAVLAGACRDSSSDVEPTLGEAMCEAAGAAAAGKVGDAKATFEDHHTALHELAASTAGTDRARAAELLRAKEEVEADFKRSTPRELAADLRALAGAVATASGGDANSCG